MTPSSFQSRPVGGQPTSGRGKRRNNRKKRFLSPLFQFFRKILSQLKTRCFSYFHTPKNRSFTEKGWMWWFQRSALVGCILLLCYGLFLWFTLPDVTDPTSLLASQSTVITDRNGVELYRLFREEDRTYVSGDQIPDHMKHAMISIEDERFYDRGCLDIRAIARAIFFLGQAGGGSTITRQLARNALDLQHENRYQRKLKELILGCQLESQYSKDALIELYLNWIPFGSNAYGVEQASSEYFGTTASGLTLAQSAVLASLPQRPSYFNPYGSHVRTVVSDAVEQNILAGQITSSSQISSDQITIGLLGAYAGTGSTVVYVGGRTDQVLKNMQDLGFISEAEKLAALAELETLTFAPKRENIRAPHFVLSVRDHVEELFSGTAEEGLLEQGGLRIETTLDWELQQKADAAVARYAEDISTRFYAENIALVSLDPQTNEVLAYVGNADFTDEEHGGKIDMALAPRQPGSSFKSFVYAAAFKQGYSPATPVYDVPTKFGADEPQNFDSQFWGLMTMREALGSSRNIPAAKAYFLAGQEDEILTLVSSLGASSPLTRKEELQVERGEFDYGWPLALGAAETPLIEMANAYGALARGGSALPLVTIRRITDKSGNLLYEAPEQKPESVLDERIAYQITSILSDESVRPEDYWRSQLTIPGYQTAAKTGTSNKCLEWKDTDETDEQGNPARICIDRKPDNAWLMGYTPNLVTGVWVGNADSSPLSKNAGGLNTASPVWRDFMISAHRILPSPKSSFSVPDEVVTPQISTLSGQLPTSCTPIAKRRPDVFLRERSPSELDPACAELIIDQVTGLLASDECPAEARATGSFLIAQSLLPARWPQWEEGVQDWVKEQMLLLEAGSGSRLPLPVAPTEYCRLDLTPGRMQQPEVTIVSPVEYGSATYPVFRPSIQFNSATEVQSVSYVIDGYTVATITTPPFEQALRVPRSISESGQHTLTVTLTDTYFNTATATTYFRFEEDTTSPTVQITLPHGDISLPVGGQLSMEVDADDPQGGLKYVQFYLDDTLLTTKPREPFSLTYTLTEGVGTYRLRAVAVDTAGNTSEDFLMLTITE